LHDLTVEARQGLLHQGIPGVLIVCLGCLLQENVVTHRRDPHQTQTARKRFILRQRDHFVGHLVSQTHAFLLAVRHDGLFYATVDLLLRAVGGADKPIEARELQEQTHQANPTGTHFGIHQVGRQHQPMQEGETCNTVKKRHDCGASHRDALGMPAMPAGCCEERQAPWPLDAGSGPGLVDRHTAHTAQRVRCGPSVDGDHHGHVADIE